jgi:hypothetical protein
MSKRFIGGFNKPGYDPLAANVTTGATTVQNAGVFTTQTVAEAVGNNAWVADPYFNNTVLLLQADGFANGSQNNTFIDSSVNNFAVTRNGTVTQGTFTPYLPGQWSFASDNVGDYVTVPPSTALTYGTGDFTIEFWVYLSSHPAQTWLFDQRTALGTTAPIVYATGAATNYGFGNTTAITSTTIISPGVWTHIAVSKASGTTRLFVNGVQAGANYTDANNYAAGSISFGRRWDNVYFMNGYMTNVRVLKGTALYTTTFVPPTEPLTAITDTALLTFQDPWFKDNSVNNATLSSFGSTQAIRFSPYAIPSACEPTATGGSGYFDGTGNFLTTPANVAFTFGTGAFTIEGWMYLNATTTFTLFDNRSSGSSMHPVIYTTGTNVALYVAGANVIVGPALTVGQWYHIAVAKSGTSTKLFVNGVQGGSTYTDNNNYAASGTVSTGAGLSGANPLTGYISNLRVVKGTAVYTTDFTPPTAPLTATQSADVNGVPSAAISSGTSLLLNFNNAGIYDATGSNNITTVNNTQVSTGLKKYGSGSIFFDGTGDYLTVPTTQNVAFGTSNFTIEFWAFPFDLTSTQFFIDTRISGTSTAGIAISKLTATNIIYVIANNTTFLSAPFIFPIGTWIHVALVRFNGVLYLSLNGYRLVSAAFITSLTDNFLTIGTSIANRDATTTFHYEGYMDDLRITNGIARYTTPYFTPPPRGFAKQ